MSLNPNLIYGIKFLIANIILVADVTEMKTEIKITRYYRDEDHYIMKITNIIVRLESFLN